MYLVKAPFRLMLAVLTWGACGVLVTAAQAQGPHRFGETIGLIPDASLVVTRTDVAQLRARYPAEFPASLQNIVAFEFHTAGNGKTIYAYSIDRADPARSDVVATCDTTRLNILRMGSGTSENTRDYQFGAPTVSVTRGKSRVRGVFGSLQTILAFALPPWCNAQRVRLSVVLEVSDGRASYAIPLVFAEH